MLETIKSILYEMLKEKQVSLAMVFKGDGEIVWHKGRNILGNSIKTGEGFTKTFINECLDKGKIVERSNGVISAAPSLYSESAERLMVKSVIVYPIDSNFFLYVDSGLKDSFSDTDRELFKLIGKILNSTILYIMAKEKMLGGITGISDKIKKIREKVLLYSITEETVLLLGETGTGKNHIARFIHEASGRKGKFVILNTPGIPETLLESELFGYKKGAFTGAITDKRGLIEEAIGGTLFIDEIGEVSGSVQSKLLRLFDDKKYSRVGDTEEKICDVRIISATNKDLVTAIKKGEFREDLYFRMSSFQILIPPLRERKEDIKPLVLENISMLKGKKTNNKFWDTLNNYNWPGNVRELISLLRRIGVESQGELTNGELYDFMKVNQEIELKVKGIGKTEKIWRDMENGKTFWEVVREPFLDRELNKSEVRLLVERGLALCGNKYVNLLEIFNLKDKEYKKFMNFLSVHKIVGKD